MMGEALLCDLEWQELTSNELHQAVKAVKVMQQISHGVQCARYLFNISNST